MASRRRYNGSNLHWAKGSGPHWLIEVTGYGKLLTQKELPPGTDLLVAWLEELLRHHRLGSVINEFSSWNGEFFLTNAFGEKRRVAITASDPSEPRESVNVMNIVTGPAVDSRNRR